MWVVSDETKDKVIPTPGYKSGSGYKPKRVEVDYGLMAKFLELADQFLADRVPRVYQDRVVWAHPLPRQPPSGFCPRRVTRSVASAEDG